MNRDRIMRRLESLWDRYVCSTLTAAEIEDLMIKDLIKRGVDESDAKHWTRVFLDT